MIPDTFVIFSLSRQIDWSATTPKYKRRYHTTVDIETMLISFYTNKTTYNTAVTKLAGDNDETMVERLKKIGSRAIVAPQLAMLLGSLSQIV